MVLPIQSISTISLRRIIVGGLLLATLALGTRLIGLGTLDLWGDEVYSHIGSTDLLPKLLRWETIENESSSPLPFLEVKVSRQLLGNTNFAVRLPSAIHSAAAVVLLYLLIGRFSRQWGTAWAAGLLLAVHPFALNHGRDGRMYSQWLLTMLLVVFLACEAVRYVREHPAPRALDWRWWTLGMTFAWAHAYNILAVFNLLAMGLALGGLGVVMLRAHGRKGLVVLLGTALASGVYLSSWALTGIGKMLMIAGSAEAARGYTPPNFTHEFGEALKALAGHVPLSGAFLIWLAAAAGLGLLLWRRERTPGGGWLVLLLVLLTVSPWLSFPPVAQNHFYAPRYVFVSVVGVCVGLGALGAWAWPRAGGKAATPRRAAIALALVGLALMWLHPWRTIYTQPQMAVSDMLAPVVRYSMEDEVLLVVPDWYVSLNSWYSFGAARLMRGPEEARYAVYARTPTTDLESLKPFDVDYYDVYVPDAESADMPPAAWVVLINPKQRFADIERLLAAYGLDDPRHQQTLQTAAGGATTLTMRLSHGRIDYLTVTFGRRLNR